MRIGILTASVALTLAGLGCTPAGESGNVAAPVEKARLFSSPEAAAGGSVWGQAIGVTSIVFGSETPTDKSPAQIVIFTGLLRITKMPVAALADGRRRMALRFDSMMPNESLAVRSANTPLGYVKVAVDPDEAIRSTGTLT